MIKQILVVWASIGVVCCAPKSATQLPAKVVVVHPLSPGPDKLAACDKSVPIPTSAVRIGINKLDIRHVDATILEYPALGSFPYADTSKTGTKLNPDDDPIDPLNINLSLQAPSAGKRNSVYIVVALDDKSETASFLQNGLAVTSLDANGKQMLCYLNVNDINVAGKTVAFVAKYFNGSPGPNGHTHGSFNINLSIPDSDGIHALPISLDPDVENNG